MGDCEWRRIEPALSSSSLEALEKLGFSTMTPVQSAAIPYFLSNKDVAVEAVTGSGKTLAFAVPVAEILQRVEDPSRMKTGALVVVPTRELACQVAEVLGSVLPARLQLLLLIGGSSVQEDVLSISHKSAHVIVGTPGRLVDLLARPNCQLARYLKSLEVLVLDEADRLLDLGFEESINTILSYLPKQRRTGLFSATLNVEVKTLMKAGLRDPAVITVREKLDLKTSTTPKSLQNFYVVCEAEEKFDRLMALLWSLKDEKVMVFFATCVSVSYFSTLTKRLTGLEPVFALHGRMHKKRAGIFNKFMKSKRGVLMCTDVMARGVDFPRVHSVIQYDPPSSAKSFIHRCGRTARMGLEGNAILLLLPSETAYVEFLGLNQGVSLEPWGVPALEGRSTLSRVVQLACKEREVYELGLRAFVSFINYYMNHDCKLIFNCKELDFVALGKGFGLLHLPKMPEVKGVSFPPCPVDPASIPYKCKHLEKLRLAGSCKRKGDGKSQTMASCARDCKSAKGRKRRRGNDTAHSRLEGLAEEARTLKRSRIHVAT